MTPKNFEIAKKLFPNVSEDEMNSVLKELLGSLQWEISLRFFVYGVISGVFITGFIWWLSGH